MWARVAEKHHFSSSDAFKHINLSTAAPFLKIVLRFTDGGCLLNLLKMGYLAKTDNLKATGSPLVMQKNGKPHGKACLEHKSVWTPTFNPQVNANGQILP